MKDGPKNRLREQDIHKIVDIFNQQAEVPRYSRMVPLDEIADPKNDFNLNLPRYIDSTEPEDLQDIDGHLRGGIPERDIDALERLLGGLPERARSAVQAAGRPGYARPQAAESPRSSPPSSTTPSSPPSSAGTNALRRLARRPRRRTLTGIRQGRPSQGADRDPRRGPAGHIPQARRCSMPTTSTST